MFTCNFNWLSVGVRFVYDVHIWFKPQTTYGICLWWSHVILNELQFYDVHIWCSHMIWLYMMFVYDLPYMMHICDLPLITYDDHMWFKVVFMLKCSHMMFTYDLHVYDVGIWCSHMMLGYDVHIWTCLKIIYGFPLRCTIRQSPFFNFVQSASNSFSCAKICWASVFERNLCGM